MLTDPGGRAPAPGALRAVQAFVNTLDIENGVEELTGDAAVEEVLRRVGALPAAEPLEEGALAPALAVREALRALALANNGAPLPREAETVLTHAARAARLGLCFVGGASTLVPGARGLDGALGRLLAIVHDAQVDGSWSRLKGCPREVCHWVFYDRSRNGSSRWCAMSVCGNRVHTKAYRRRTRVGGGGA